MKGLLQRAQSEACYFNVTRLAVKDLEGLYIFQEPLAKVPPSVYNFTPEASEELLFPASKTLT